MIKELREAILKSRALIDAHRATRPIPQPPKKEEQVKAEVWYEMDMQDLACGLRGDHFGGIPRDPSKHDFLYLNRRVLRVKVQLEPWKEGQIPVSDGEKAQALIHDMSKLQIK